MTGTALHGVSHSDGPDAVIQLNPPLPVHSPKGPGLAHLVIDYGPEADLLWVVFLDADGTCWAVPNPDIRLRQNWSLGRRFENGAKDAGDIDAAKPGTIPIARR